jgi:hypothetical protein
MGLERCITSKHCFQSSWAGELGVTTASPHHLTHPRQQRLPLILTRPPTLVAGRLPHLAFPRPRLDLFMNCSLGIAIFTWRLQTSWCRWPLRTSHVSYAVPHTAFPMPRNQNPTRLSHSTITVDTPSSSSAGPHLAAPPMLPLPTTEAAPSCASPSPRPHARRRCNLLHWTQRSRPFPLLPSLRGLTRQMS